jgi:tripartite-type tricarboxylate transporter receptor subunit TctC
VGSPPHLTLELLQNAAGVKFVHVPYRGAAPALTDLLGGQVQVFAADLPVLMSNIKGGKIRALAVASGQRNPMLKDVETLAEQGYPDTTVDNWYGLLAPAKTPPTVIGKIHDAFVQAINDPGVKQKLVDSGAIPVADTPAEFGKFFKAEYERWGKVVRERGIKEN